ncbi:carbohydrate kinase family protein [Streptomyces iconiensis]|uniref:Carbohydrate kinase n=1 Tax=Streptomyces iconiensis TaxID=1384038 RepID=A0ABT7A7Y9_9ACTN|nr:carbohydrate kinase [Streptomyces iconiensis]MDJ1136961.1 carbohydrate kinase [Streptomyces iconiensis]
MSDRSLAVLGECVADTFVTETRTSALSLDTHAGGGPANTAVALARLGTPTRFLGRLSHDVFGRLFRGHLAQSGVDLTRAVAAAEPSTLAVASLDDEGRADYSFHAAGTADWQWTEAELKAATAEPMACLHTGSLALVQQPGAAAVERLLDEVSPRTTISLDPNVRPLLVDPAVYREALPRWCAATDVLRLSDDDLAHLRPGASPEEAADIFHGDGARLVVVTLGGDGVFASLDGLRMSVDAPRTRVVDTVGAGDSFMAGFLHALHAAGALGGRLDGLTPEQVTHALAFGTRVAAAVVSVRGANPPWAADLPEEGAEAEAD